MLQRGIVIGGEGRAKSSLGLKKGTRLGAVQQLVRIYEDPYSLQDRVSIYDTKLAFVPK
jgi:hypothetical protein